MTQAQKNHLYNNLHRVNALVNTALLGIITFFLIDLHKDFKEVKNKVQEQAVRNAVQDNLINSYGLDIEHIKNKLFFEPNTR